MALNSWWLSWLADTIEMEQCGVTVGNPPHKFIPPPKGRLTCPEVYVWAKPYLDIQHQALGHKIYAFALITLAPHNALAWGSLNFAKLPVPKAGNRMFENKKPLGWLPPSDLFPMK